MDYSPDCFDYLLQVTKSDVKRALSSSIEKMVRIVFSLLFCITSFG